MATHTAMSQGNNPDLRASLELKVGILHFVSPKETGWNGVLRKRFTDFQVHEIDENGQVVHLSDFFSNVRDYERAEAAKNGQVPAKQPVPTTRSQNNGPNISGTPSTITYPGSEGKDDSASTESQTHVAVNTTATEIKVDDAVAPSAQLVSSEPEVKDQDATPELIPTSDVVILKDLLGDPTTEQLIALYKKILADPKSRPQDHEFVKFSQISDKSARSAIHSEIRRIFASKIDTETSSDGIIQAKMQSARGNPRISNNRNRGGQAQVKIGKFLHFSLYKENKDTMEAVNLLAGALGMKPNFFSTAGTKDRRAVTVQRVSIRGRDPKRVLTANAKLRGLAIGDFKFSDKDLFLGSHNGNEFTIVLKDCAFQGVEGASLEHQIVVAQSTLEKALADIAKHGFINYFGTQRFGTFEIGTHILGMKILQGDLKGVVQDLLSFDPSLASIDPQTIQGDNHRLNDVYRAKALAKYKDSNDPEAAAKLLPRRCNTEFAILRHLCKQSLDYHGAVMSITRNMRNMYLHAYQSLVWNFVASKRWELFGSLVVKGDLVYEAANAAVKVEAGNQESDDEENIHLTGLKSADESAKPCARALTADEAASGLYSINDVILPIPGTDVIYPENELSEFYKEFMGREENGALDPHKMHRSQKAFSLTGDYRKIMGSFIGTPSGEVRTYTHDNDQLVPTDLDKIKARANKTRAEAATAAHGEATAPWDSFARTAQSDESKQAGEDLATNQRRKADNIGDDEVESRVHETWVQTTRDGSNKRVKVSTTTTGNGFENQEDQKAQVNEVDEPANGSHQAGGISGLDVVTIKSLPEVSTTTNLVTEGSWSTRFKKVLTKLYDATLGNIFKMPNTDNYLHKTALRQNYEQAPKPLNSETTDQITDKQDNQTADLPAPLTDTSMIDAPSTTLSQVQAKTIDTQGLDDQEGAIVSNEQQKIAVILRFSLGSSAYATMVLRELQG